MSESLINYIKNNKIVQYGNFTLASGKQSNTYFDIKKLVLDSDGLQLCIPPLMNTLSKFDWMAVGGIELGAIPILSALLAHSKNNKKGFIVRKEPKDHGTKKYIEGPVEPGMKVAIVEDVATSGGSLKSAIERSRDFGLIPVVAAVILDREEGASELINSLRVPFVSVLTKEDV